MIIDKALFQTVSVDRIRSFYSELLGFPVLQSEQEAFTLQAGVSELSFQEAAGPDKVPFYHFAFTIPENKLEEAKAWIESKKIAISTEAGEQISFSESWNSHSVYFEDPAGNILELIARHTMDNGVDRPFDPARDLLCISEIGLPTGDVSAAVDQFAELGILTYKVRNDSFNPIGDDNGLFIVCAPGRRWHFTNKTAESFPVQVTIRNVGQLYLSENEAGLTIETIE